MKRPLRFTLIWASFAAAIAVFASSAFAGAFTYYVSPTGSGSECTELAPCSLAEAKNQAVSEDSIVVAPGTYPLASETVFKSVDVGGKPGAPVPVIQTNGFNFRAGAGSTPAFHDLRIEGAGSFGPKGGSGERIFVSYTGNFPACTLEDGGSLRDVVCWVHSSKEGVNAFEVTAPATEEVVSLRNVTLIDASPAGDALHARTSGAGPKIVVNGTNVIARSLAPHADIELENGGFGFPVIEVKLDHSNYAKVAGEEELLATVTPPGTNGNQTAVPTFVNLAGGDFREAADSPTIDAGVTAPLNGVLALGGEARALPRCLGGPAVTDIGAYEFAPIDCSTPVLPSNRIKLGKLKLNRKQGTATLEVKVPDAGKLTLSGKGVKKVTRSAKGAVTLKLPVKPVGKWKKRLLETGKLKVSLKLKFVPTGGTAAQKSKKATLKENLR